MKRVLVMLTAVVLVLNANAQEVSLTYDPDVDGDNNIGVTDLLALLSLFSENDLDDDGIWDSQDDCVGEYDECGVCNGEGPTVQVIDSIIVNYDSVFVDVLGEGLVFELSTDTVYSFQCFVECGLPWEFQGYEYSTVEIGDQCWFAENLRTEHYTNGDSIPANLSDGEWSSTTSGAVAVYGEDEGCEGASPDGNACDPDWSLNEYGRLYNWYAVDDARGLCPTGWHVPSDEEWMTLEMELGMSESEANDLGWRGTDQGTQMKTTYGWYSGGNGTNSSGFSGLPGGARMESYCCGGGYFGNAGWYGFWWSSSQSDFGAYSRWFRVEHDVRRVHQSLTEGLSIRCLRDAE